MSEAKRKRIEEALPPSFGDSPSSKQPKPLKDGPVVPRPVPGGPFGPAALPLTPAALPLTPAQLPASEIDAATAPPEAGSFLNTPPPSEDRPAPSEDRPASPDASPADVAPMSLDWQDPDALVRAEEPPPELTLAQPENDPYLGTTVGDRYVVDSVLGEGGMGRVYGAHHKIIGKRVAIKVLHAELAKDKEAVSRFVREAQAASSIGNEHIVDISDFGELSDGATFFVMEYLDGESLGDLLESKGALKPSLVYHLALQICDGLSAAHSQQIVHRDLKPDNITVLNQHKRENFVKLLDFGIAKVSGGGNTKLTMAGAVFGTPHYMSPEQAAGTVVDHRTDIYSLGVVMYEMASGEMPFNADNFMGILTQHMYKAPVPIRALVSAPECPPGLEAVILKCLSKKPDARYNDMAELAADLRLLQNDQVPSAVHDMMARSGSFQVPADYKPQRRGPQIAAAAGIVVAVVLVASVMLTQQASTANSQAPAPSADKQPAPTPNPRTEAASAKATVGVLLHATPKNATAKQGDRDIKLPKNFRVPKGSSLELVVSAPGYLSQRVRLTADKKRRLVELRPKARTPGTPAARPKPKDLAQPSPKGPVKPLKRPRPRPAPAQAGGVVDPFG